MLPLTAYHAPKRSTSKSKLRRSKSTFFKNPQVIFWAMVGATALFMINVTLVLNRALDIPSESSRDVLQFTVKNTADSNDPQAEYRLPTKPPQPQQQQQQPPKQTRKPFDPNDIEYIFDFQHDHQEEGHSETLKKLVDPVEVRSGTGMDSLYSAPTFKEILTNFRRKPEENVLFAEDLTVAEPLMPTNVFEPITSMESAGAVYFESDPHKYRVCKFSKMCFNSTHTLIPVGDEWERAWLERMLEGCPTKPHPLCNCFSSSRKHVVITPEEAAGIKLYRGKHFLFDKYIPGKHIGHWTETVGLMHSILLHAELYGITDLRSVSFLKDVAPLTDHESSILAFGTKALSVAKTDRVWADEINLEGGTCYEEAFSSTLTARIATNTKDATALRHRAFDHFGFELQECPPPKTVLLHRSGDKRKRTILNENELERVLSRVGLVDIERTTISHLNSSLEQALLFNQAGLIISPHGSELVNAIFSQPNAALVEVVPTIFNYDFAQMGLDLSTRLWFSVGGKVDGDEMPEEVKNCNQLFKNCVGEPRCCKDKATKAPECGKSSPYASYSKGIKQEDFVADAKAFERVIREMVKKHNQACGGHWPGVRAPSKI